MPPPYVAEFLFRYNNRANPDIAGSDQGMLKLTAIALAAATAVSAPNRGTAAPTSLPPTVHVTNGEKTSQQQPRETPNIANENHAVPHNGMTAPNSALVPKISAEQRSTPDYFGYGLALLAAVIAFFTLRAIRRQADTMDQTLAEMRSEAAKQAIVTAQQIKIAEDTAKAANTSAEVAKRTLTEIEAPILHVKITQPGLRKSDGGIRQYQRSTLVYRFINYGHTPAYITAYSQKVRPIALGAGAPEPLDMVHGLDAVAHGFLVPPNGQETEDIPYSINFHNLSTDDLTKLHDGFAIYLMVAARYRDIFNAVYEIGFAFIFDDTRNVFVQSGDADPHNFFRQISPARALGFDN